VQSDIGRHFVANPSGHSKFSCRGARTGRCYGRRQDTIRPQTGNGGFYFDPAPSFRFAMTSSKLKLAAFCR
jgi:hypothetical protein